MAQIIQQLVAPAVMISACGLLSLAQYNRLAVIVGRLRQFHHERLVVYEKMLEAGEPDKQLLTRRYTGIGEQADQILLRAKIVRNGLACLVGCVLCMLGSSLAIGLSLMVESVQPVVVGLFILGVLNMSAAMVFALLELRASLTQVEYEHDRIGQLEKPIGHLESFGPLGA